MNSLFYLKLAVINMKKNAKTYIPFLMTCIVTIGMFYIMKSLSVNDGIDEMLGAVEMKTMLGLGSYIIGIFAIIFLFYTNSFLVKRRKKEFGLFNILGMEKKHIGIVIAFETLLTAVISLVLGLVMGISLDKFMYMLIAKMFSSHIPLGFYISTRSLITTTILFSIIFIFIYIHSIRQISTANPIELLHGSEVGEKEPKAKILITMVGFLCLAGGYWISVTTQNPITALLLFFVAVILVIIGTYLLFTSGSVTVLKLMKKNKHYYYKTNHFINVSSMIFRMKQNAVGLANICILSTMVLVMLSSTLSLWFGIEGLVEERYPYDVTISNSENRTSMEHAKRVSDELVLAKGIQKENIVDYQYLSFTCLKEDDQLIVDNATMNGNYNNICVLFIMTLDDYQNCTGNYENIRDDEILLYTNRNHYDEENLKISNYDFHVKKVLDSFVGNGNIASNIASTCFIVVHDEKILNDLYQLQGQVYGENKSDIRNYYGFDINGSDQQKEDYSDALYDALSQYESNYRIESKVESYDGFISLYGSFLFIGIFLSVLFIMAAILIIYYKQITEGYEDKERYEILQKVGMDHKTVKQSIHSQVLTVFFLPLIVATVHVAFASPIMIRLLKALMLKDVQLFIYCTIGCIGVFAIIYVMIYLLTARSYYAIVKRY